MDIRVVCLREGSWWVAQCLEVDLCTQAKTLSGLEDEMTTLIYAHIIGSQEHGMQPFDLGEASAYYWEKFDKGKDLDVVVKDLAGYNVVLHMRTGT